MSFKDQFAKLIDLKSIITMSVVFTLVYIVLTAMVIDPFFSGVVGVVLGYYFGKIDTKTLPTNVTSETKTVETTIPPETQALPVDNADA